MCYTIERPEGTVIVPQLFNIGGWPGELLRCRQSIGVFHHQKGTVIVQRLFNIRGFNCLKSVALETDKWCVTPERELAGTGMVLQLFNIG